MRSVISIILIVCAIFIVVEFVLACVSYKNREKIIAFFKRKKTWSIAGILMSIIALIPVGVILIYVVVTPILMMTRGDCFPAYHISMGENRYIYYEEAYYVSITDDEEKCNIAREYVEGNWIEKGYVRWEKMQFPYVHYWIPGYFLEELTASDNNEYLYTHEWAGSTVFHEIYQRVEE